MTWKQRYQLLHEKNFKSLYPEAFASGHYFIRYPKVNTANGLQKFCVEMLLWSGNHGEKTNTMGRPITKTIPRFNIFTQQMIHIDHGIEWQKGAGTKGSSDVKGHVNNMNHKFPIPIYLEIKIGRDIQSKDQVKYETTITKTGAFYRVIKTPDDYLDFFDEVTTIK